MPGACKRLSAEECILVAHWFGSSSAPFVSAKTSQTFAGIFEITKRGKETINHGLCNRLDFCAAQAAYIFNKPDTHTYLLHVHAKFHLGFWNAAVLNKGS